MLELVPTPGCSKSKRPNCSPLSQYLGYVVAPSPLLEDVTAPPSKSENLPRLAKPFSAAYGFFPCCYQKGCNLAGGTGRLQVHLGAARLSLWVNCLPHCVPCRDKYSCSVCREGEGKGGNSFAGDRQAGKRFFPKWCQLRLV